MLEKLRDEFEKGKLSKEEFIQKMNNYHDIFFEYAQYLEKTNIEKIEVSNGNVILSSKVSKLKFECKRGDLRLPQIEALNFGAYELEESKMMYRLIKPNMTVFDIGANIGWFSLNFAILHKSVLVHAFEPVPDTFAWLRKNIELNRVSNIETNNFGFSDEPGEFEFFIYPEGSGGSSMADNSKKGSVEKIICSVETMDDYCEKRQIQPDFIKCDVEGAELFVFQGGKKIISEHKPIVFTEMLRKWASSFNYNPNEIIECFSGLGYDCFEIVGESLVPFKKMDEKTKSTNFIFLHVDKHQFIIHELIKSTRFEMS